MRWGCSGSWCSPSTANRPLRLRHFYGASSYHHVWAMAAAQHAMHRPWTLCDSCLFALPAGLSVCLMHSITSWVTTTARRVHALLCIPALTFVGCTSALNGEAERKVQRRRVRNLKNKKKFRVSPRCFICVRFETSNSRLALFPASRSLIQNPLL